jgi:hypothetical protein
MAKWPQFMATLDPLLYASGDGDTERDRDGADALLARCWQRAQQVNRARDDVDPAPLPAPGRRSTRSG